MEGPPHRPLLCSNSEGEGLTTQHELGASRRPAASLSPKIDAMKPKQVRISPNMKKVAIKSEREREREELDSGNGSLPEAAGVGITPEFSVELPHSSLSVTLTL